MRVEILKHEDNWQSVKDAAMNTIGKESGIYPSSDWKWKMLRAEHSPIRLIEITVRIHDLPYWIAMHLVRHKIGIEHFVSTQRSDRTGEDRSQLPQSALIDYTFRANAQAFITISRKRLCHQASPETRAAWKAVLKAVAEVEPELASLCVPECFYRGFCPELRSCGYIQSAAGQMGMECYRAGVVASVC